MNYKNPSSYNSLLLLWRGWEDCDCFENLAPFSYLRIACHVKLGLPETPKVTFPVSSTLSNYMHEGEDGDARIVQCYRGATQQLH